MTNDKAGMTMECPNDERVSIPFGTIALSFVIVSLTALSLLCGGCAGPHEASPRLVGRISGNSYTSPRGRFSVPFPVSPEVGGRVIRDDPQSVTFHDNWGNRISFYSKAISAQSPMMSLPHSEQREKALGIFMKEIYGGSIEPHYHPDVLDGTVSFIYLRPVGSKTGVATFIHQNRVYLVETDLVPGVEWVSKNDEQSRQAREVWLENRAVELLQSIEIK